MRKLFLTTAFYAVAVFSFIFSLVYSLLLIDNSLHGNTGHTRGSVVYAALPTTQNVFSAEVIANDGRVERIRQFLAAYGSPLEPFAQDIVDSADLYGIDYRLTTAIAMQESNLCKKSPEDWHNCWGFGIYTGKTTRFSDYREAIYTITRTLATKYIARGLTTPEQIMTMYTPSSNGSWAFSVRHFMEILK